MADDRAKSSAEADEKSGRWNSKSTSWGDARYMSELGKAGIRRQQERMRDTADAETSRLSRKSSKRKKSGRSRSR